MMDAVAHALADPVRRGLLEALAEQPLAAGDLAARFTVSRPAVSRHLRVLRESGLVTDRTEGRHRMYALDLAALGPLVAWIAGLDRATSHPTSRSTGRSTRPSPTTAGPAPAAGWDERLDALSTEVRRTRRDRRRARPSEEKTA